jgi:TonB family protein
MFSPAPEEREKRRFPLWPVALVLTAMAAAALGYYFLVLKGPDATARPSDAKPAVQEQAKVEPPSTTVTQPPIADLEAQAAENRRREEELKKQLEQAAAEEAALKQKIQDEKRARQLEEDRQKKAEEERLRQEELARLQKEEEQRRQEEADRLAREALEKKKAEEQKELERKRVKEGDLVPLGNVDKEPQVLSKPDPIIPNMIRSALPGNQTVRLNLLINQNGDVEMASLLQKTVNSQLNAILIDTIKTWKYSPAVKDGVRVKVWKTVSLIIKK